MCKRRVSYCFVLIDYDPFTLYRPFIYFQCPSLTRISGVGGINGLDLLLSRVEGFQVTNGYLKFLPAKPAEEAGELLTGTIGYDYKASYPLLFGYVGSTL